MDKVFAGFMSFFIFLTLLALEQHASVAQGGEIEATSQCFNFVGKIAIAHWIYLIVLNNQNSQQ